MPKRFRERFRLKPDTEVELVELDHQLVLRKKATNLPVDELRGILRGQASNKTTDEILEELRGR